MLAAAPPNDAIASPTVVGAVPDPTDPPPRRRRPPGSTASAVLQLTSGRGRPRDGLVPIHPHHDHPLPRRHVRQQLRHHAVRRDRRRHRRDRRGGLQRRCRRPPVRGGLERGRRHDLSHRGGTCCGSGATGGGGNPRAASRRGAAGARDFDLSPSPAVGSFSRYGVATIRGTITCQNTDGQLGLDAFLTQPVGKGSINGGAFGDLTCSSTPTAWSIEIPGEDGKFLGGKATVDVFAGACGPRECSNDFETKSVTLRH